MVRVGPEQYEATLTQPHVRPMDFTGRPLNGYVYVASAGYKKASALEKWVQQGTALCFRIQFRCFDGWPYE